MLQLSYPARVTLVLLMVREGVRKKLLGILLELLKGIWQFDTFIPRPNTIKKKKAHKLTIPIRVFTILQ